MNPVDTIDDAMLWLGWLARFGEGDVAIHAAGCVKAICAQQRDLACAQERAARLAGSLESLEASTPKGGTQ